MKGKHFLLATIVAILAILALAGCGGGSKSHDVGSPWNGDIRGVDTNPPDGKTNVAVDTWVEVFWPDPNYEPPESFTFKLYVGTATSWDLIKTVYKDQDSDPDHGSWWFAPENNLAYDTDYKIVITDNYGGTHVHYFTTTTGRSRSLGSAEPLKFMPKNGGTPGGTAAEEHVIRTR